QHAALRQRRAELGENAGVDGEGDVAGDGRPPAAAQPPAGGGGELAGEHGGAEPRVRSHRGEPVSGGGAGTVRQLRAGKPAAVAAARWRGVQGSGRGRSPRPVASTAPPAGAGGTSLPSPAAAASTAPAGSTTPRRRSRAVPARSTAAASAEPPPSPAAVGSR